MKRLTLAATALAFLALAACGRSDEDRVDPAEAERTQSLEELSQNAANLAAESQALENQAQQLEEEAQQTQATEAPMGPETPADENIEGM